MLHVFVHRRAPGQFVHLIDRLVALGHDVVVVAETFERLIPGARCLPYRVAPPPADSAGSRGAADYHVRTGEAVAGILDRLRAAGCRPGAIVGHAGWGGLLFAKDVFPDVPVLGYCEFFHHATGSDFDFGRPEVVVSLADRVRIRLRNAAQTATLSAIEAGLSPTRWQRDQYPAALRTRIAICHDGIDTAVCRPDEAAVLTLPDGRRLSRHDRVVTFAARDLDPYRGFPQFVAMAARLAATDPSVVFVAVGGDGPGYGARRRDGRTWREAEMAESGLDPRRIVFPGWLPHRDLLRLFQVSAAHVYLTVPFVLSWSLLEAMACGALVVGSATPPLAEVVEDGRTGRLVDFFDTDSLAATVREALARPAATEPLRRAARRHVRRFYDLEACLARQLALLGALTEARPAGSRAAGAVTPP
jgi:glycosyltransferase involved in cell wall biosynthesis